MFLIQDIWYPTNLQDNYYKNKLLSVIAQKVYVSKVHCLWWRLETLLLTAFALLLSHLILQTVCTKDLHINKINSITIHSVIKRSSIRKHSSIYNLWQSNNTNCYITTNTANTQITVWVLTVFQISEMMGHFIKGGGLSNVFQIVAWHDHFLIQHLFLNNNIAINFIMAS